MMMYLVRKITVEDAIADETTMFAVQKITAEDAAADEMMMYLVRKITVEDAIADGTTMFAVQKTAEGITETAAGSGNRTKGFAH
jgi:hypothetical protein